MLIDLKPGWLVCDIGANTGAWTAEAAKAGATVVACEALAEHRNAILAAGAAVVLPVAVSDIWDSVVFHIGQDDRFSSVSPSWVNEAGKTFGWGSRHVEVRRVDTMRLDNICKAFGWFDFIKIDTEGHEPAVIRSLGDLKPDRLSIEYHGGQCALQSLRGVTEEAIQLLGDGYMYRFAAESNVWLNGWVGMAEAIEMLGSLDWGDLYALKPECIS
jgi:FkbM family methyltransferase